jgi:hypothetical protein
LKNAILFAILLATAAHALPPPGMPQESIDRVAALNGSKIVWDVQFNRTHLRLTDDDGAATVAFAFWLMSSPAGEAVYLDPDSLGSWLAADVELWHAASPWLKAGLERLVTAYAGQSAAQQELIAIRDGLFKREIVTAPTYGELNALARWCDAHNRDHQYWVEVLDANPHWPYPRRIKVKLRDNDTQKNPIGTALSGRTYELRPGMVFARYRTIFAPGWQQVLGATPPGIKRTLSADSVADAVARAESQVAPVVSFARLHGVESVRSVRGATVPLATALEALSGLARGLDHSGHGDVDYWFRAATDLARTGRAIGKQVVAVGRTMPDDATARIVIQTGVQLSKVQASGTGDVDYWLASTKGIADQLASAGAMLSAIASASSASTQGVPLRTLLEGFTAVAKSVDAAGTGTVDFWMRCAQDGAQVSRAVGKQLKAVSATAPAGISAALAAVSGLFSGVQASGSGTVDYWLARATAIARQVHGHADMLTAIAQQVD